MELINKEELITSSTQSKIRNFFQNKLDAQQSHYR